MEEGKGEEDLKNHFRTSRSLGTVPYIFQEGRERKR